MKNFKSLLAISAIFSGGFLHLEARAQEEPITPIAPPAEFMEPDTYTLKERGGPNTLQPGVIGETYMGISMSQSASLESCETLTRSLKDKMVDPRFTTKAFVYDYIFYCEEVQPGMKVLLASLIVEPESDYEIPALTEYREKLMGESIMGMNMMFTKMKGFEVEKNFTAMYVPDLRHPTPVHSFNLVSTNILKFPNFHQFRMHVLTEQARVYYAKDANELKAYLATYLHPNEMKLFEEKGLKKSNLVLIGSSRRNVFKNNDKTDALINDSNLSVCEKFGTKFCMME